MFTKEETEALVSLVELAYEDQKHYLATGNFEGDYGADWPETAEMKAAQFACAASALVKLGLPYLADRCRELGEALLVSSTSPDPEAGPIRCRNCDQLWVENDLKPIEDIYQRVAPGEPMPSGECPECGSLCQEVSK